jgi:predicted NUDIX family NTP pyrophosphohydrolase
MRRRSAGLLMFRRRAGGFEFFLVHPGGPFFARKSAGVWSIPKGEGLPGEDPQAVARREFMEETGQSWEACGGREAFPLGSVRQAGGKIVEAWGFEGDWPEGARFESNTFELEWPPRSGRRQSFPEADQGGFFVEAEARQRIHAAQAAFLDRVIAHVAGWEA